MAVRMAGPSAKKRADADDDHEDWPDSVPVDLGQRQPERVPQQEVTASEDQNSGKKEAAPVTDLVPVG
jgi:hypothetical protein